MRIAVMGPGGLGGRYAVPLLEPLRGACSPAAGVEECPADVRSQRVGAPLPPQHGSMDGEIDLHLILVDTAALPIEAATVRVAKAQIGEHGTAVAVVGVLVGRHERKPRGLIQVEGAARDVEAEIKVADRS